MAQLIPLNDVRKWIKPELFPNVQDKELLKGVCEACNDDYFWLWLATFGKRVLLRLAGLRHWSLVCNCIPCKRARLQKKRVRNRCPRASRRLGEVVDFLKKECDKMRDEAMNCKPEDAQNNQRAFNALRDGAQKAWSLLKERTKYLSLIPWRFVTADTPEGAKACLEQLARTPDNRLDPLSKYFKANLVSDMENVRDGGPCSLALHIEVQTLNDCPLDESAGEGYHRETHLAHQRAPAASTITVVQEVRFNRTRDRIRGIIKDHGKSGRHMLRFEWHNWKRILQVCRKLFHRPKQLSATAAMKRIYRMDEKALDNWDLVVGTPVKHEDPVEVPDNDADALRREYLAGALRIHSHFSVEPRAEVSRVPPPPPQPAFGSAAASSASASAAIVPETPSSNAAAPCSRPGSSHDDGPPPAGPESNDPIGTDLVVRDAPRKVSLFLIISVIRASARP